MGLELGGVVMTGMCCVCWNRRCVDDVPTGKYPKVDAKTGYHLCAATRMGYHDRIQGKRH